MINGQVGVWLAEHGLDQSDLDEWSIERLEDGDLKIPIKPPNGEVALYEVRRFGGRKYEFQPQGSRHGYVLYGLDRAATQIDLSQTAVVVEGVADCIALHKAGIRNAVSTLTSSLTRTQWALLTQMAKSIIIWFDGDQAGDSHCRHAAERLADVPHPASVVFATLDGFDPASLFAACGAKRVKEVIAIAGAASVRYRYVHLTADFRVANDSVRLA